MSVFRSLSSRTDAALAHLAYKDAAGSLDRLISRLDKEFVESEHPRAEDGKFGNGAGGAKSHEQATKTAEGKHAGAGGTALPAHIQKLKIPPAWTDVTYSPDPSNPLQVTGKDAKGRRQAIYSDTHTAAQAAAKFARINALNSELPAIQKQNEAARKSTDAKKRDAADCLGLIMSTGIRPGSEDDTGADKKAYGATTLEGRHVVVEGGKVTLKFVGKKGVSLSIPVEDTDTAAMLRKRKETVGDAGQLFGVSEKALLDHTHTLGSGGFKTKDFRTLLGTRTAVAEVSKRPAPKGDIEYKKAVMLVAKAVSSKLGNTPVIALQSYISPAVFDAWRMQQ